MTNEAPERPTVCNFCVYYKKDKQSQLEPYIDGFEVINLPISVALQLCSELYKSGPYTLELASATKFLEIHYGLLIIMGSCGYFKLKSDKLTKPRPNLRTSGLSCDDYTVQNVTQRFGTDSVDWYEGEYEGQFMDTPDYAG